MPVIDEALDALRRTRISRSTSPPSPAPPQCHLALLVELRRAVTGKKQEQALMSRILTAMLATPKVTGRAAKWADHE